MNSEDSVIKIDTILLKRGTQAALENHLVGENKPKQGEIIFELPSSAHPGGLIKVGDGIRNYSDLPYFPDNVSFESILTEVLAAASSARSAAADASSYAASAELSMARAERAAEVATSIPEQAVTQVNNYVSDKLHFMSMAEYNELTELSPDGFYFISVED